MKTNDLKAVLDALTRLRYQVEDKWNPEASDSEKDFNHGYKKALNDVRNALVDIEIEDQKIKLNENSYFD